jgi:hypothetical protein
MFAIVCETCYNRRSCGGCDLDCMAFREWIGDAEDVEVER